MTSTIQFSPLTHTENKMRFQTLPYTHCVILITLPPGIVWTGCVYDGCGDGCGDRLAGLSLC